MGSTATALEYYDGDVLLKGVYYRPENSTGLLPVVLVTHAWDGLVQEIHNKARRLAEAGYIAFAIDVYGNGRTLTDMSELGDIIGPLLTDRSQLIKRMQAALVAAKTIPGADENRIGAMGYCFGGLCVLDLARGGCDVKGVVTFHGTLLPLGIDASLPIIAKVLVLHGQDDPIVPPEQLAEFQVEMDAKQVDWQVHTYSNTVHAFTRAGANDPNSGSMYNALSDQRSWQAMLNFYAEIFAD